MAAASFFRRPADVAGEQPVVKPGKVAEPSAAEGAVQHGEHEWLSTMPWISRIGVDATSTPSCTIARCSGLKRENARPAVLFVPVRRGLPAGTSSGGR